MAKKRRGPEDEVDKLIEDATKEVMNDLFKGADVPTHKPGKEPPPNFPKVPTHPVKPKQAETPQNTAPPPPPPKRKARTAPPPIRQQAPAAPTHPHQKPVTAAPTPPPKPPKPQQPVQKTTEAKKEKKQSLFDMLKKNAKHEMQQSIERMKLRSEKAKAKLATKEAQKRLKAAKAEEKAIQKALLKATQKEASAEEKLKAAEKVIQAAEKITEGIPDNSSRDEQAPKSWLQQAMDGVLKVLETLARAFSRAPSQNILDNKSSGPEQDTPQSDKPEEPTTPGMGS